MNSYNLTLLIKENLDEKERKALLENLTKQFGKLTKEDLWGVKDMVYSIKRSNKAYYAHFEFESEANTIPILDKSLRLNEDVIRYLLIKR